MTVQSVSGKQLVLEIRKTKVYCELKRHLSPKTVGIITRSLPLEGHVHFLGKNIAYIKTTVDSGTERARKEFKKGDIAFLPSSSSICFFLADTSSKVMTPIGRLNDTSIFDELVPGDTLRIYAA